MSCFVKQIKSCEIFGDTINSRIFSFDISVKKVNALIQKNDSLNITHKILEINDNKHILNIEDLNLIIGNYKITYIFEILINGKQIKKTFCIEELVIKKAGCNCNEVINELNLIINLEEINIPVNIDLSITNINGQGGDLSWGNINGNIENQADLIQKFGNYYNKTQSDASYKPVSYTPTWSEVSGKPTTFTPSEHTHTIAEIDNLQNTLANKADLVGGKVPANQLPAYVDDVLEFANLASFPATGENGKIYIAIDTNLTYRWGGSSYVVMSSSLALGETSSTAYRGDRGKVAYDHSQVTHDKTLVGLGNVDNTSDLNKPISTATQSALDLKENVANKATDLSSPNNNKYPTTLAVVNETKKATITVELISQLTTNFYAPNALRINSTALISGSGTLTLKVNDVAYTLTDLIPQGAKITAETTSSSVYNLISIYE